ncbi:MAG: lysophospholipid acyltransferase family protein [Dysgonomonas sp.]
MNRILYYIIYLWMFLHALLPLRVLYVLSDILYLFVYKIASYRLHVVKHNLEACFPDKTEAERRMIEKKFYHHFCDYFVETIKLLHISDKEMQKRMKFENLDLVRDLMKDGNSVMMYMGHYCNWEWVPSITLNFKGEGVMLGEIYKPLKNKAMDEIFLKIRSRFGSLGIPKNETLRTIVNLRREKKQTIIGFIADQTPSVHNIHYWTNFLNQDTPVFTGVERIAKKTGFAVTYLDLEKVKRGYYKGTVRLITSQSQAEPENAITEAYTRAMETTILRSPAYWLWTHKRWKRTREEVEKAQQK